MCLHRHSFGDFNPRSSCEERRCIIIYVNAIQHFNPRSSCEERLIPARSSLCSSIFQSTLLMRGATSFTICIHTNDIYISIHAPHARSDKQWSGHVITLFQFQSTLLMRGATRIDDSSRTTPEFQSTLLMRGATIYSSIGLRVHAYFNPRSSCEERHSQSLILPQEIVFQSTLLMRGATISATETGSSQLISIHAPHARSDSSPSCFVFSSNYFNPRSSCEERRGTRVGMSLAMIFQSTLLMRGATPTLSTFGGCGVNFNPRSSCEERPCN